MNSTPLLNDDATVPNKDRPRVAALLPFAVVSALREMMLVASMRDLTMAHFPDLFALNLTVLAAYVGVTPPVYSPGSNKSAFIPNREAYKINPARVAQESLKNFLLCAGCDAAAEAVLECSQIDLSNSPDYFLAMMPSLTRAICENLGHMLPKILTALGQYSSSPHEAQRAAVTAFNVENLNKNYSLMRSRRFRPRTTNTTSGAHGGIVQSRTEVDLILTDFDKDKREAIVSLPRKMLVKYTAGHDCQHQKKRYFEKISSVDFNPYNVTDAVWRIDKLSPNSKDACVQMQCAGQSVLIDSVLSNLLSSLTDPSALVRRLSLKGLANISFLDSQQLAMWDHCSHVMKERHSESVLEALIQGLDDHDAECHSEVALQAMMGLSQVLPSVEQSHVRDIQVAIALRVKPFFEKENVELRTTSLRLLGELAVTGGSALPGFQDQIKACLVCLLMHLSDMEMSVVKACKFSLRAATNVLEAEKTKAMMNQHLIDDAMLHYQQFITDLAKLMVEEMADQIPIMITTALTYGKSAWAPIRASSALFIGALYSSSPSYVRERVSLEAVTLRLLQQIKDPEKEVRSSAAHAFSLLFTSPT
ncbi:Mroh1p [Homalodisca vitripennis]|nr:Mroh1p [Homalodisca vitripennis]